MQKSKWNIILAFLIYLLIPSKSVLAKIEINNSPSRVEINKEFELDVALANLSDPTHFLSIAIHKNSGDPYFGQTKSGDSWIAADDSNCKSFPQATVKEGSWSGKLTGKINYKEKDFDNSLGNYILKVFKYTDSCNKSSSNDITVELFDSNPPPTPTPTSTPTNAPTPKPTHTGVPSATPTAKPIPTPTIYISKASIKVSPTINLIISPTNYPTSVEGAGSVLGENTQVKEFPVFFLLLGSGLMFLAAAVILGIKARRDK